HQEHKDVVSFAVKHLESLSKQGKRVPFLIAGAGSNSTREAVELTAHAKKAGATVCLSITPYYNRPTQAGLFAHYTAIADEVGLPIIPYNVPSRTGVNLEADTIVRLSEHPLIVGVKEASGNTTQISEIVRRTRDDFLVFSGDDAMTLSVLAMGGDGVISVSANIAPGDMTEMCRLAMAGDFIKARRLHHKQVPLIQALFRETNPIPVKTAMNLLAGQASFSGAPCWPDVGELRSPLVPISDANLRHLKTAMREYGLSVPE
ncbi:MAG TPA: 4-hydroxy-tetrahydrodipicolinate synthase, partial [bacterium]|nr:4-hydroxy-tetrahydrodipicolinate synthase [bacterium]